MKIIPRVAGITLACSLAVGLVIHGQSAAREEKIVVSQQSSGSTTTVADAMSPEEVRGRFKRMSDLIAVGLVPPAKTPYCCDPTSTIDPALDQTQAEPSDDTVPDPSPVVPDVPQSGRYVVGQGCTRGADAVLVCPPDQVPPIVSAIADRGSNGADWYRGSVTVSFISRDPLPTSGQALPKFPPPIVLSSEGQNQLVTSAPSCDPAGNCATGTLRVSIDSTNPTIQALVPANAASYVQGSVVPAGYTCSDVGSGINPEKGCSAEAAVGAPIDTTLIGSNSFTITATDVAGNTVVTTVDYLVVEPNQPPMCVSAIATPSRLWPANHQMVPVEVTGVTDPDSDPVTIRFTSAKQDEPTNGLGDGDTSPDVKIAADGSAAVRAERSGQGDGRVYKMSFTASDTKGGTCTGLVAVRVPKNPKNIAVDSGTTYDGLVG